MSAGERCAARLLAEKEGLALAIADALYRERPELAAKYGETGRAKCVQDMRYNLEHLAPAVALDDPSMFAGYARWLAGDARAPRQLRAGADDRQGHRGGARRPPRRGEPRGRGHVPPVLDSRRTMTLEPFAAFYGGAPYFSQATRFQPPRTLVLPQ
jgi:hypothetical protein